MDWSKAKTLLIVALLVTDLVLGGFLLHGKTVQRQNERKAAEIIGNYLVDLGAELNCELADDSRMLPVLFISFPEGRDTSEYSEEAELYYNEIPVIVSGYVSGTPTLDAEGASRGDIRPSAYAAAEVAGELMAGGRSDLSGLSIDSIDLVYWLYYSGSGTSDTAFPYWRFNTSEGAYFVSAYYE